jgi:predicted hydrolase (HD superfamily)
MGRLKELRIYVDSELNKMEDEDKRNGAIVHLYGVSLAATMIAKKRGLDTELASMAAMLHDLYAYKSGSYDDHAHKGAELARQILGKLGLTDDSETEIICSAIYHHDDKLVVDSPMDEVLKDADVIHHCMNDLSKDVKEKEKARFGKLCEEFGM